VELIEGNAFSFRASNPVIGHLEIVGELADAEAGSRYPAAPTIAIIESRPMTGECLSRSICEIEPNYSVFVYPSLQAWHRSANFSRTSLVLLSARSGDSADAETADIERNLTLAKQLGVQIPLAVLSDRDDASHVLKLIEHGVRCYITSNLSVYMAVRSIQFAIDGGISIPPDSFMSILKSKSHNNLDSFTARQRDIIREIEQGKQNKAIAHDLHMSEGTVKVHVRNIMRKLNAKNRTEIVFRLKKLPNGDFDI
ncbi:MAG: LuxR C-terminal-related transcriptional regulator, partial [Thermomicrobiales bacterium]